MRHHRIEQTAILNATGHQDNHGVCAEVVKRWIKAHVTGRYMFGMTLASIYGGVHWDDVIGQHALNRNNNRIDGLTKHGTRSRNMATFAGLRTNSDALNYTCTHPGAYLYAVSNEAVNAGHAFGFCSLNGHRYVLDPNFGEFDLSDEDDADILDWWGDYWSGQVRLEIGGPGQGSFGYKRRFTRGRRELRRYTVT